MRSQRQARFVYFQGTGAVCVVLGLVGARLWGEYVGTAAQVAATLFGAFGAVVSVFQRASTGDLGGLQRPVRQGDGPGRQRVDVRSIGRLAETAERGSIGAW